MMTPGPWLVFHVVSDFYRSIGGAYFIKSADGKHVARLTDEEGDRAANAKVLAAGPVLMQRLEALADAPVMGLVDTKEYAEAMALLTALDGKPRDLGTWREK